MKNTCRSGHFWIGSRGFSSVNASIPPRLAPVAKDVIELIGKVVETFPNATFQVKVVSPEAKGHEVLCHLAGRMRVHRVQILPGDNVRLEMTPYDLQKGRITYRFRPNQIINEDGTITEVAAAPHVHRRPPPRRR